MKRAPILSSDALAGTFEHAGDIPRPSIDLAIAVPELKQQCRPTVATKCTSGCRDG